MARSAANTESGAVLAWPANVLDVPAERAWLVAHCLPRQDRKLTADLRARAVPHIMFQERRIRHYPGKGNQVSMVPLLGGYVFVQASRQRREEIFATKRVVNILDVAQPASLIMDLRLLFRLVSLATAPLLVRPEILPGMRIKIASGALSGCEGVVERRQGVARLVVNLHLLGTSVAVELPAETAEPVPG